MGMIDTLKRIPKILESNINAILDKCEDPVKMIDQMLIDYKRDLADVKRDTVEVMANYKEAEKRYEEQKKAVANKEEAAKRALKAGNEDDARQILASKQQAEVTLESLRQTYEVSKQNAEQMKAAYNKLVADIDTLEQRRDAAVAKISYAKTQQKISKVNASDKAAQVDANFARYEAKAEHEFQKAQASAELDAQVETAADIEKKYSSAGSATSVDDELAKMKAELGL